MTAMIHALQIGTLATWLSVVGFGVVGWWGHEPQSHGLVPLAVSEVRLEEPEIVLGAGAPEDSGAPAAEAAAEPDVLPTPPALPDLAVTPLPEIPDLPEVSRVASTTTSSAELPASKATPASRSSVAGRARASNAGADTATRGGGQGVAEGARLAAGNMPAPIYPEAARRAGQTGTVVVAFTIDTTGRVISAQAASPSSWPLLNEEAVRTVRRWKFPPGGVMKIQRPIVFQLR